MCETTNEYEIVIKSNDTLFVLFITTTRTPFIYTGKVIVWSFIVFQKWSRIKTEKNVLGLSLYFT